MRIAIDIDDTIAQTTNYLMPFALSFNTDVLHKDNNIDEKLDFPRCFNWSTEELGMFLKNVFEKEVLNIPIFNDADKYINLLRKDGHKVIIVSSRNDYQLSNPFKLSEQWLNMNNIKYDKLYTGVKYKDPVIKKEKIDIMIDDSVGQCTFILEHNEINVIMFAKSSNEIDNDEIKRIESWEKIYTYITNLK